MSHGGRAFYVLKKRMLSGLDTPWEELVNEENI